MGGVDSSCHVQTNVSVRRGINVQSKSSFSFFLYCVYYKATKNFEVNVDVQKEGPKVLRIKLTIDMLVSFSSIVVIW